LTIPCRNWVECELADRLARMIYVQNSEYWRIPH
jgi:hypothetical protein